MKTFGFILVTFFLVNCSSLNTGYKETIYWVNSAKLDCIGVSKTTCFQIQKGNSMDLDKKWNLFYSPIIGFNYQPGFIYKLKLKEEPIENPPADGSSVKFTLLEVLEKKEDTRYKIHDLYTLQHIQGQKIESSLLRKKPTLEINITKMQISGNNGCNQFSGSIVSLQDNSIRFSVLRETKMMCENMDIPSLISRSLSATAFFKKDLEGLHFLDSSRNIILSFKKVD